MATESDLKYQLQQLDMEDEEQVTAFLLEISKRLDHIEQALAERYAKANKEKKNLEKQLVTRATRYRHMSKEEHDIKDYATLIKGYIKKVLETGELIDPKTLSYGELQRIEAYSKAKDEAIASLRQKIQQNELKKEYGITLTDLRYSDLNYLLFKSKGQEVEWYPSEPIPVEIEAARYDKNAEIARNIKETQEHRRNQIMFPTATMKKDPKK